MTDFRFFHPIEVRYSDLDPQGHLNNAKYMSYFEQARIHYVRQLGLWPGGDWKQIGFILAEARVTFLAPVHFGQAVQVGVSVVRLGNKSLDMVYSLREGVDGEEQANGSSVLVAYDYRTNQTIPLPDKWRQAIREFEGLPAS